MGTTIVKLLDRIGFATKYEFLGTRFGILNVYRNVPSPIYRWKTIGCGNAENFEASWESSTLLTEHLSCSIGE
jgi:hypothetical protein